MAKGIALAESPAKFGHFNRVLICNPLFCDQTFLYKEGWSL